MDFHTGVRAWRGCVTCLFGANVGGEARLLGLGLASRWHQAGALHLLQQGKDSCLQVRTCPTYGVSDALAVLP